MNFAKSAMLGAMLAATVATGAFAKGHDQGNTEVPGQNVGAETVAAAHTLGEGRGNRPADKGPKADSPAVSNAGR